MIRVAAFLFLILGFVLIVAAWMTSAFGVDTNSTWPDVVLAFLNGIDNNYWPGFGCAAIGLLILWLDRSSGGGRPEEAPEVASPVTTGTEVSTEESARTDDPA
jgi:hypothetical protein